MSEKQHIGLCEQCIHHSSVTSAREKEFHLCNKSKIDKTFPKYPKLPVVKCKGYTSTNNTNEHQ